MASDNSKKSSFGGFDSPNYTQVPDQLFDELLTELSGAELKVLLYIIRRTFGFKKQSDSISLSQMLGGIRTKEGKVLDLGVGVSKPTLLTTLRSLKERGIIETTRRRSLDRGDEPTVYRLHVRASTPGQKCLPGGGKETSPGPWANNTTTQETVLQETDISKNRKVIPPTERNVEETEDNRVKEPSPRIAQSGGWKSTVIYDEAREVILEYIRDFAPELGDEAKLAASVTRAQNLLRRSGVSLDVFIGKMYEARSIIKENSAKIRKQTKREGAVRPLKNRMPYWFATLQNLLPEVPDTGLDGKSEATGSPTEA